MRMPMLAICEISTVCLDVNDRQFAPWHRARLARAERAKLSATWIR